MTFFDVRSLKKESIPNGRTARRIVLISSFDWLPLMCRGAVSSYFFKPSTDYQFRTVPHAIFSFGFPVTWSSVAMTYGIQNFLLIHRFHFLSVFVSFTAD